MRSIDRDLFSAHLQSGRQWKSRLPPLAGLAPRRAWGSHKDLAMTRITPHLLIRIYSFPLAQVFNPLGIGGDTPRWQELDVTLES
jgi:hypothetical protein